jgi:hypothetical protein
LLFLKGNFRRLPIFTTYVAINVCQAGFLYLVYVRFGFHSRLVIWLAWASQAAAILAEALATTEILRAVLVPYKGIWGLGWRTLMAASGVLLIYVTLDTRGDLNWALITAERGCHLIFATAIIICLLLVRYYSISVPRAYKALLGGFCFFSCTIILINTIAQGILYRRSSQYEAIWEFLTVLSYAAVQVVWAEALRKPLAVPVATRSLPAAVYQQVSPEINERLRELNEKLLRLWRLEAHPR